VGATVALAATVTPPVTCGSGSLLPVSERESTPLILFRACCTVCVQNSKTKVQNIMKAFLLTFGNSVPTGTTGHSD
jgi:hypothetical protein